jgi:hypothetical protein
MCHCRQVKCEIYDRWKGKKANNFHLIFSSTPQCIQFLLILKNVVHDKRWNEKSAKKKCLENPLIMKCEGETTTEKTQGMRRKIVIIVKKSSWNLFQFYLSSNEMRNLTEKRRHISPSLNDNTPSVPPFSVMAGLEKISYVKICFSMNILSCPQKVWACQLDISRKIYEIPYRISLRRYIVGGECKSLVITNFNFTQK